MKRKFSMFLNIAMLCLCVCAIAFGVYSAKQASLNVTGSIGFTAHNCKVKVDSSLSGFSETLDGEVVSTARTSTKIVEGTATLDLGTFYFTDLTASGNTNDITLMLTFTNQSDFAVDVTIEAKDLSGSNITVTLDTTSLTLAEQTAAEGKTGAAKVTLKCTSTTKIDSAKFEILSVNMAKYTEQQATGLTVQSGAINGLTGDRNYVTMGKYNNTQDLKWYIFAKSDSNGDMQAVSTNLVDNNATLPAGTYWFISEYVLDRDSANDEWGIPFDAGCSQIYNGSDIQTYLNNVSETATTTESFAKKYNFSADNNATYNYLMTNGGRDLPSETGSGSVGDFIGINNQYFWLLSVSELAYLAGEEVVTDGTYTNLIALDATSSHAASDWWSRSPRAGDGDSVLFINPNGYVDLDCADGYYGVRPAFQITIPA